MNRDEKIYAVEYTYASTDAAVQVKVKNALHSGFFYEFYDDEELRTQGKYRFVPEDNNREFRKLITAEVTPERSIDANRKSAKALTLVLNVDDIKEIIGAEVVDGIE